MIQCPYFILILALVAHTCTIHTCIYTVYIPILYLFYTCILYFYSVLYFNQKYIWSKPSFYTRLVSTSLFIWWWTFQDITLISRSGVIHMLKITKSSMRSGTYFILQTTCPKQFPLWHYRSLSSNPEGIFSSWRTFTMNQTETEKCDEFNKFSNTKKATHCPLNRQHHQTKSYAVIQYTTVTIHSRYTKCSWNCTQK